MNYYTHAGLFHCDEVTGYVICKLANICNNLVRQTDLDNIPNDGLIADIGQEYNPVQNKYDHHQTFLVRENGYPLATAGLLWKEYGVKVVKEVLGVSNMEWAKKIAARFDVMVIQGIDAHDADNSYQVTANCVKGEVNVITLPMIISTFNADDVQDNNKQYDNFIKASEFLEKIFINELIKADKYIDAEYSFEKLAEIDGDLIVLTGNIQWKEIVINNYPNVKYVVCPSNHPGSPYSLIAVPVSVNSRELKQPIFRPDWFTGFIHLGKWIAGGQSIDELVKLAKFNLND